MSLLTKEEVAAWNERWPAGSKKNIQELLKDLQLSVQERMTTDFQISVHQLGHWLVMNGWTPTRGKGSEREWRKNQQRTRIEAAHVWPDDVSTTQGTHERPAKQRPCYIDFRRNRMPFSKMAVTKNVIFDNRKAGEPSFYWELACFIKILNADNEKFHMAMWWQTHRQWYEKLQMEFDFHPLTLLPGRQSLARWPGIMRKTDCTQQTLMSTRGLLTMLLHWATNCHMSHQKREAARAMFNDLLDRNLEAVDGTDAMWHAFRNFISENKLDVLLVEKHASSMMRETTFMGNTSLCEMITTSCMYLFANRKKGQDLHACLVKHLKMLEARIDEMIVTGRVGHETVAQEEHSIKLETEAQKNIVQKSGSSSLSSNRETNNLASTEFSNTGSGGHQSVIRMTRLLFDPPQFLNSGLVGLWLLHGDCTIWNLHSIQVQWAI